MNVFIINNTAESGSALYGGLLDRCTVNTLAELYNTMSSGEDYIMNKTVKFSNRSTITSEPLQVIYCGKRNHSIIATPKGGAFKISVKAIDQVGNPVNATIHSSVVTESGVGRLKENRLCKE